MIICTAQDFAFGPIAALVRLVAALREQTSHGPYVLAASGVPLELGKDSVFDDVVPIASDQPRRLHQLAQLCSGTKGLLSVCDFECASGLLRAGIPACVYDMLLWFWDATLLQSLPPGLLVLAQSFPGTSERVSYLRDRGVLAHVLSPLVICRGLEETPVRGSCILVNLNGFSNPLNAPNAENDYGEVVRSLLEGLAASNPTSSLLVTGGSRILESVRAAGIPYRCRLKTCQPREFESLVAGARAVLTTPGLGSIYECFASGTPTFLLPPTNATQRRQMEAVRKHVRPCWSFSWEDAYGAVGNFAVQREQEEVTLIGQLVHRASVDETVKSKLLSEVMRFLQLSPAEGRGYAAKSLEFVRSMGGVALLEACRIMDRHFSITPRESLSHVRTRNRAADRD